MKTRNLFLIIAVAVCGLIAGRLMMVRSATTALPPSATAETAARTDNAEAPAGSVLPDAPADTTASAPESGTSDPEEAGMRAAGMMLNPEEILLSSAKTLEQQDSAPDADGRFLRTRLVRADFKYPLLRVEETFRRDSDTGAETLEHRQEMVADHIMVMLQDGATERDLKDLLALHGGEIRRKMHTPNLYLVEFVDAGLNTVRQAADVFAAEKSVVKHAEVDYVVHALETIPNDPSFEDLWGMHNTGQLIGAQTGTADADIDAPEAWDIFTGSRDIVVGVIDTGVDYNHEDLAENMWINPGEIAGNGIDDDSNGFTDDIYGWNFIDETGNCMDDNRHGTHCSGTIGGAGNNGVGVAGVCWKVKIAALKFLSASGSGAISDATEALNYAVKMRFKLTSNSWGGGDYNAIMEAAIAVSGQSNMLFVAAAGNESKNNDTIPHYPSNYTNDNVIAVAATDNQDQLASFSCYGLTSVDLGAPGVQIYSCKPNNIYEFLSGTSMATPHVAGAAALAWGLSPSAGYLDIKDYILDSVDPVAALNNKCVTGGRLNVFKMLALADPMMRVTPFQVAFSGFQGGPFLPVSSGFILQNTGAGTVSWTASESAAWLDMSATAGSMSAGQSNLLSVTWNSAASALSPGTYTAPVTVSNSSNGRVSVRQVTLEVLDSLVVTKTGLAAAGPDGGPFSPVSVNYVVSNGASTARTWTGRVSTNWMELSVTNGTLAAGAKQTVTLSINANANALGVSTNIAQATFSNHTSGIVHVRPVTNTVYESLWITPTNGMLCRKTGGGAFNPDSIVYTISNRASSARDWSSLGVSNWVSVTPAGGTLAAGAATSVTVALAAAAGALPDGTYYDVVTFSNAVSGICHPRTIIARVNVDDFTERFELSPVDLAYRQLIFHPTNTLNGYVLHRAAADAFPVSTNSQTRLTGWWDDGWRLCSLTGGKKVLLFGTAYSNFYISANGHITFTKGTMDYDWTLEKHFEIPRISMFLRDLNPTSMGSIWWAQLSDRAVATYYGVPFISDTNKVHDIQAELFFDGTIRITYLRLGQTDAVVGLSRGGGIPANFINSDLSTYSLCPEIPAVEITRPSDAGSMPAILVQNRDHLIMAEAVTPPGSTLTGVDFLVNGSLLGTDTAAPYSIVWPNVPAGSYTLTAVAYTSLGQAMTSRLVNVTAKIPDLTWQGSASENWHTAITNADLNWTGDAAIWMDGSMANFRAGSGWGGNLNVQIQAAGVEPYGVLITNVSANPLAFRGGDITGGDLIKAGTGTATFTNYTGSLSFPGGAEVRRGTLRFVSLAADSGVRTQWFGAGPIRLSGGTFSFAGDALANGQTNVLANPFIVAPTGTVTHGRYGTYSPKIVFGGDILFSNNAALTISTFGSSYSGVDSNGVELSGTVTLNGSNELRRTGHGGTYLTLSGSITDGTQSGRLVIFNTYNSTTAGRYMKILGAANTYSGGTVIRDDNLAADFTTFAGAVEVGANSRLGTGDVIVEGGGLLRLTGADNIHPDATLELRAGGGLTGTVWIASGVTNGITTLILGPDTYTAGVFTSSNAPGFIAGPGAIRLAGDTPRVLVSATAVNVPEGGTNTFGVKWSLPLTNGVTVTVARVSGDTDITVLPASLVFAPGGWDTYQYVTLAAAEDSDWLAGTAVIRCSAGGLYPADVTASEEENDQDPSSLLPFTETFDGTGMATNIGILNGQHGWTSGTNALVQAGTGRSGKGLSIEGDTASHAFVNGGSRVALSWWMKPVPGLAPTSGLSGASAVIWVDINSSVTVFSNSTAVVLPVTVSSNAWNLFEAEINYASNVWKLSVNGTNAAGNLALYSAQSAFAEFALRGPMLFDDLNISNLVAQSSAFDEWLITHYGTTNVDVNAFCSNGVNTILEAYIAGLNPNDPQALFRITGLRPLVSGNVLEWQGASGRVYSVYWSSNLLSGFQALSLGTNIPWTGSIFTDSVHGAGSEGFYRIKVDLE